MKWYKAAISGTITLLLVVLLNIRYGVVPAPGPFFNPVSGFWQSTNAQPEPSFSRLDISGLQDEVYVLMDDRGVPHIFAENDHDLYMAQGYVTARDRLWQLDMQVRSSAGRLSEILGKRTVDYDLFQRRIGMGFGAENKHNYLREHHPDLYRLAEAYSDGVNAYIDALPNRELPLEFKLFGYRPNRWEVINMFYVQMAMASTLNRTSSAHQMTNNLSKFGEEWVNKLFPHYPEFTDPIIPEETRWDFTPERPSGPDQIFRPSGATSSIKIDTPDPNIGSNSWAVHGSRTESGAPLLANDMHLNTTLPAIWYEVQLNAPGVNVYGVSLPGTPGVIVGFNENVSWGFTNSGATVLDIFEIEFEDESKELYFHDNEWKSTNKRLEKVKVRGGRNVKEEVVYTHHGPVPFVESAGNSSRWIPGGHAVRWVSHDPSADIKTFYKLNRAANYDDFLDALRHFDSPAQNFTYADRNNTISLWHNGKFPVRWFGQGDFISDGRDPQYDWEHFIPREHLPHSTNPDRGYVSSANQHPVTPHYPYYLGRTFASFERGARINEVLDTLHTATPDDMMRLHMDAISLHPRKILPMMTIAMHTPGVEAGTTEITGSELTEMLLGELESWDYNMLAESRPAMVFKRWWHELAEIVWSDIFEDESGRLLRFPDRVRLVELMLHEPDARWFRKQRNGREVGLNDHIRLAFDRAVRHLEENYGSPDDWEWYRMNNPNVAHLANIEALGHYYLKSDGAGETVNAVRGSHGPSWRMVVSMEDEVRAWGVYPGGQSGDPGSRNYDNTIEAWTYGGFYPLNLFRNTDEAREWFENPETRPALHTPNYSDQ